MEQPAPDPLAQPGSEKPARRDRTSPPFNTSGSGKRVSRDELLDWWPHSPLLVASEEKMRELNLVEQTDITGGRDIDEVNPLREGAIVSAMYYPATSQATPNNSTLYELTASGARILSLTFYPAWSPACFEKQLKNDPNRFLELQVRGVRGYLRTSLQDGHKIRGDSRLPPQGIVRSNVNRRLIFWYTQEKDGAGCYQFQDDPTLFSDDEALAFVESMLELR